MLLLLQFSSQRSARIVFDITLEGTAKKVITVRSALLIQNKLPDKIELKLTGQSSTCFDFPLLLKIFFLFLLALSDKVYVLDTGTKFAVPIPYVSSRIYVRPSDWGCNYCSKEIFWSHATETTEFQSYVRGCDWSADDTNSIYRFCVSVYRQKYPPEEKKISKTISGGTSVSFNSYPQPGHLITLCPPISFRNLLPFDISLDISGTSIKSELKAGSEIFLRDANIEEDLNLRIHMEYFKQCKSLTISKSEWMNICNTYKIMFEDRKERLLQLFLEMKEGLGGCLKLVLYGKFWIINKTGLPLMFKQDDDTTESAGQFDEHEAARCVTPFVFSYANHDASEALVKLKLQFLTNKFFLRFEKYFQFIDENRKNRPWIS